jgi:hypothetical protein
MTDDRLREAYRALQGEGSPACPSDDELAGLVLGEDAEARRTALADHVVSCRRCSESVAILLETHREISGDGRTAPAARRRRWLSLAAAAAALVVIGFLLARPAERIRPAERGPSDRMAGVVPADGTPLAEPPERFEWPPSAEAESYRLEVYRDSGELVWDSGLLATTHAVLPADARARLAAGAYYWVVEVEGSLGRTRTGPFSFRVGRR